MSDKGIAAPYAKPGQASDFGTVFVLPVDELNKYAPPWFIAGLPVRAIAPHPERDDLLYLTTAHPDMLAFLPDPYIELD